jgi:MinD superfamily P-loop ATPase
MKQMTVLSGKGGTGKTTITASFAVLAKNAIVADCDVDAPDLHMLLHPEIIKTQEFKGSKLAVIDESKCIKCSLCREKCRFNAVTEDFNIDTFSCEGCGVCTIVCPVNAITLNERISGHAYISKTRYGFMSHALLSPGEANSGKLVTLVRQNAKMLAEKENSTLIIIDGPPGIGCPVIASVTGVDAGLVVTEPTMSGIHDLKRALQLLEHFNVLPLVYVNMYDVNKENSEKILGFCKERGIEIAGRIPFNSKVTEAMVNGKTIVEHSPDNDVTKEIENIWKKISSVLEYDNVKFEGSYK